jgi:hypothetical protein
MAFIGVEGADLTQQSLERGEQPLVGIEIGRIGRAASVVSLAVFVRGGRPDGCFAPATDNARATLLTRRTSCTPGLPVAPHPSEVIETLNKGINAILAAPSFKARLADLGASVFPGLSADFVAHIARETIKWEEVVTFSAGGRGPGCAYTEPQTGLVGRQKITHRWGRLAAPPIASRLSPPEHAVCRPRYGRWMTECRLN